jgi:hypothetical protein
VNAHEMYEEDLPDQDEYTNENVITSQELAEKQLRYLKYWNEEERIVVDHYHKEKDRIELWKEHKLNRIANKKRWHEHGLHLYLETSCKKKIDLVHGIISKSKGREIVDITDSKAFELWFLESKLPLIDFYITTHSPSKALIKKHIKDSGEIPEGCSFERNPDKIKVEIKEYDEEGNK